MIGNIEKKRFKCRECNPSNPAHINECYMACVYDADLLIECIGGWEVFEVPWIFRSN